MNFFSISVILTLEKEAKTHRRIEVKMYFLFNPFVLNKPFLSPVKTSENFTVFDVFRG